MGLSTGRSACGIYRGVQSHQRVELYLLPAISSPLTSYHSGPCSYAYCSCGRGDLPSAIGFSVRKHNQHNYTEIQAASLKRWVRWRGVRTATQRGKSSGGMYRGVLHVGRERNPLIPVGLILVYIASQVLSQHTKSPLNTPLQFGMKRCRLNFLGLKDLSGVSEHFANEVCALVSL